MIVFRKDSLLLINSIFLFFYLCNSLNAQNNSPAAIKPVLPLANDWEDYNLDSQVTGFGKVRIGLTTDEILDLNRPVSFYVLIPDTSLETIQIVIKSQDSKYEALKLFYNIKNLAPGIRQFEFPTKYGKLLSYTTQELSILAILKNDHESSEAEHYLIASWTDNIYTSNFVLNINSRTDAQLNFIRDNRIIDNKPCVKIENTTGTKEVAFNTKCFIPRELVNTDIKIRLEKCKSDLCTGTTTYEIPLIIE